MTELPELHDHIKLIWSSSYRWRENEGSIEFALESAVGDVWFPLCMAPEKVQSLVFKWVKMGIMR